MTLLAFFDANGDIWHSLLCFRRENSQSNSPGVIALSQTLTPPSIVLGGTAQTSLEERTR